MMLLRVLVIDDEPLARRRLEQHLEHMPDVVCAGTASGCREGVECIARLQPDSLQQRARAELVDEMQELVANLRSQLLDDAPASPYETEFWVRHRVTGFVRLTVSSIRWIEAEDDYVRLVTAGESHLMRGTLKDLEGRLDPQQFLRIHRSTIVRLSQVDGFLTRAGNMEAVMSCGARLRVGRSQAKEVRGALRLRERSGGSVQGEPPPCNRPLRGLPPL
jgi:DNA-binding LytR/AlgR family response regulator